MYNKTNKDEKPWLRCFLTLFTISSINHCSKDSLSVKTLSFWTILALYCSFLVFVAKLSLKKQAVNLDAVALDTAITNAEESIFCCIGDMLYFTEDILFGGKWGLNTPKVQSGVHTVWEHSGNMRVD